MSRFFSQFFAEFTPAKILANIALSGILASLSRFALHVFEITPKSEVLYWTAIPMLFFTLILTGRFMSSNVATRPIFRANIDAVLYSKTVKPVDVVLIVSIRNSGMPSIVEAWALEVIATHQTIKAPLMHMIPDDFTLPAHDGVYTSKFSSKDALYEKGMEPIQTGGIVRGILRWQIETDPKIFDLPGTKIKLSFRDVFGKTHITESALTGLNTTPTGFPGMHGGTMKSTKQSSPDIQGSSTAKA